MPPHHGGVERVAELLARTYRTDAYDVTWVSTAPPLPAGETEIDGVRLVRVRAANVLERRLGMPYPVPTVGGFAAIRREVRRADLVHVHDCLYLTSVAAAAAAGQRPLLLTQHVGEVSFGPVVDPLERLAYRTVGRWLGRRAARVVFASAHVHDWWRRSIDPAVRGTVVPNAIDVERFRPADTHGRLAARRALGLGTDGLVALFVGRLVPRKHVRDAVAAVERRAGWRLLVIGDGPEAASLTSARADRLSAIPHARMPLAYQAADAFVLPSVGEGAPLALLEALASGLPAVVSTDPAFDAHAAAGAVRVAPRADPIAAALALLEAGAERARRSTLAREWATRHVSEDAFTAAYSGITRELRGRAR